MRILIANERLLFRFGVDRVLLKLSQGLRARGHAITLLANRLDAGVARSVADQVMEMPTGTGSYLDLNEFTANWIDTHWDAHFAGDRRPDLVLLGGWPFFASIPVFRARGVRVAFLDCGAVPMDGMDQGQRITQSKLREMRSLHLPATSAILAISRFVEQEQSRRDAPAHTDIRALLLGADHLAQSAWSREQLALDQDGDALGMLRGAKADGRVLLLNLGRWEPEGYKNSKAVFAVARKLRDAGHRAVIAVLEKAEALGVPEDLRDIVLPIGFPDDEQLAAIMDLADAGLSVSRWEGFNLPVAEMQWAGKPAFALDLAAHPEVACEPAFLARDEDDLALRIESFLRTGLPAHWPQSLERFRARFDWGSVTQRYVDALEEIAARPRPTILIDASNACRDPANSGVVRVTRRTARALQAHADVLLAVWCPEIGAYAWPRRAEYQCMSAFNGPTITSDLPCSADERRVPVDTALAQRRGARAWLLLGETVMEDHGRLLRQWARGSGLAIAAIFYDAIPVLRPEFVADTAIRENHAAYMRGLGQCDLVLPISGFSAKCLREFWSATGARWARARACVLPDEMGGATRPPRGKRLVPGSPIHMLCVSTLEPRKNHRVLLEAVEIMRREHPGIDWTLTLVGNRYAGAEALAFAVRTASTANPRIRWLGIVDDAELNRHYAECTFTVYPSLIEGFGMPVVESIWHGTPCVCHDDGVMRELAADGGCEVVDMGDARKLAQALVRLSTDARRYNQLADEALQRRIRTWSDYARQIMSEMESTSADRGVPASWSERLYPGCLTAEWQMNDSERLTMTALLHRHQPRMAIEIGTYRGGSLSLVAQYARTVVSIDIDPEIPAKYGHFKNVRFLTGYSQEILPPLLDEFDRAGIAVDFVLIDGDHSAAGVRRDIEIVIARVPRAPMFVLLHDGFNPECRRGMLEANWAASEHVQWVDADFVPGRLIEHGGPGTGEMWGGLAAAYLTPERRNGPLTIQTSASQMYDKLKKLQYG